MSDTNQLQAPDQHRLLNKSFQLDNNDLISGKEVLECIEDVSDLKVDSNNHPQCNRKISHVYICDDFEEDSVVETTALRQVSDTSNTTGNNSFASENYLTMSGTLKRGRKKDQHVEVVLNMSREELEMLELNIMSKKKYQCNTGVGVGIHVLLWSLLCSPVSLVVSSIYSFFMGTITWYSVFSLFSDAKSLGYKILVPPVLIILYPFLITLVSLGLGIYAGFRQLSWCWNMWLEEFTDYEKGFYGWLCNALDIPECSPYEVVILSNIQKN